MTGIGDKNEVINLPKSGAFIYGTLVIINYVASSGRTIVTTDRFPYRSHAIGLGPCIDHAFQEVEKVLDPPSAGMLQNRPRSNESGHES